MCLIVDRLLGCVGQVDGNSSFGLSGVEPLYCSSGDSSSSS
jgi:hypothetical protein